jgi:hypothetical protein
MRCQAFVVELGFDSKSRPDLMAKSAINTGTIS